ncbi:diaminopimelate epimerase [uncultured Flavonifractor sp.]|uniref:diaminopimelate epimerase n=1 Tax=uncultured Flavonifractor sp. TaxID=1193534 RepID=UPI00262AE6FF|nr:diaminopimelate epimerase [uncultured Flavonifractor sp.]
MKFVKMHGLGNDYVILNCLNGAPEHLPSLAAELSDRHFGPGADGLICLLPSERGEFRMRIFNADGSEGEMCGNGIRCLGRYIWDRGLSAGRALEIETGAGLRRLEDLGEMIRVDMGPPEVSPPVPAAALGRQWSLIPVSMGNPHGVLFVEEPGALDLSALGPALERHPAFPGGINVEAVSVAAPDRLRMRVWERGSGETLACGTGACAALAAAVSAGLAEERAWVELPGGTLEVHWDRAEGTILLTGPAVTVYEGDYLLLE